MNSRWAWTVQLSFHDRGKWFFFLSKTPKPAVGLQSRLVDEYLMILRRYSSRGVMLTTHLKLVPSLRMNGAILVSLWCTGQVCCNFLMTWCLFAACITPILFIGTIRKRWKSLLWYVQGQRCLNIQGLNIFGTEQTAILLVLGKCLLRILATKSTTVVDYFVVFINFTIQMTEEFLKLVKRCFLFFLLCSLLFFNSTNNKPATVKFFLRDIKAVWMAGYCLQSNIFHQCSLE
jgi:hypothetical protein